MCERRQAKAKHWILIFLIQPSANRSWALPADWVAGRKAVVPFGRFGAYYNIYETKDQRFLTVGTIEPKFWKKFCELIKAPDLAERQFDFDHEKEISERVAKAVSSKTSGRMGASW
jgi:crotonobetainyl-CoA:carnitine CoA-transferase CaiB-like acyl-CoA transferase